MPAIAEPPPSTPKPASTPAPAPAPSPNPVTAPKPSVDAPKIPSSDPLPDLPDEQNEFMQAAKKMGYKKKEAAAKPDEAKPDEPSKPAEAKVDPKPDQKAPEAKEDAKATPSDGGSLRAQLERFKKEAEDSNRRYAELESKLKDTKPSEEVSSLSKQLADVQKQLEDARAEIGMLNEGETPEFKKKHQEPFNSAYREAVEFLSGLHVDDGQGGTRAGNSDDLKVIFNLPFSEARKAATQLFGDDAQYVMAHYIDLHKLDKQFVKAKEQLKSEWKTNVEKRTAEATQQREAWNAGLSKAREGLTKKHPEWFGDDGTDPDLTKAMTEGSRLWDQPPKSHTEAIAKAASVELAYKAMPRFVYQLGKAKAEIEALKAKLSEFEGSEPGSVKRKTEAVDPSQKKRTGADWDREFREALNNAR